jgi:hypothetical protein
LARPIRSHFVKKQQSELRLNGTMRILGSLRVRWVDEDGETAFHQKIFDGTSDKICPSSDNGLTSRINGFTAGITNNADNTKLSRF